MLYYQSLQKHKSRRKLKKYCHSNLTKDKTFQGIKVYTYDIGDCVLFTAKPKQKGSKENIYIYILWLNALKLK